MLLKSSIRMLVILACVRGVGAEVDLAPRPYVDRLNGFSLRPPDKTLRRRDPSASLLVRWENRDKSNNAIVWTFSVSRFIENREDIAVDQYARALSTRLEESEGFTTENVRTSSRHGRNTIIIEGLTAKPLRQFQYQEWIVAEHNRMLLFEITGPASMRDELKRIMQACMETLVLSDPLAELASREASINRGVDLLKGVNDRRLMAAAITAGQWYTMRLKGRYVGWAVQVERYTRYEDVMGLEVRMGTVLDLPDGRRTQKQVLFVSSDGNIEYWKDRLILTTDDGSMVVEEDAFRQDDAILFRARQGNKQWEHNKVMPPHRPVQVIKEQIDRTMPNATASEKARAVESAQRTVRDFYLSRALSMILPRLMDLSSIDSYGFAVYNSQINDFELRTFKIVARRLIDVNGARIDAIHLSDSTSGGDSVPSDWWVNDGGQLLRLSTDDGFVLESAREHDILQRDQRAKGAVEELLR